MSKLRKKKQKQRLAERAAAFNPKDPAAVKPGSQNPHKGRSGSTRGPGKKRR